MIYKKTCFRFECGNICKWCERDMTFISSDRNPKIAIELLKVDRVVGLSCLLIHNYTGIHVINIHECVPRQYLDSIIL